MRRLIIMILSFAFAPALLAQAASAGTVLVSVTEPMGPVGDALVRVDSATVTTDAGGHARLVLPAGRHALTIARIGYIPKRVTLTVAAGQVTPLAVFLEMEMRMTEVEEVTVSATRTERLAGETPIRVEVLGPAEVDERTQMAPSNLGMVLEGSPGVRVQSIAPALGTSSVRILGLPGQYTAMLVDGLPLYGGAASSIGPLDISPVDLSRVEVIKGPASALYGGQALGGVVNLISKAPTGRSEVLVNRRTLDVTDGSAWLSHRFGPTVGASLLLSGTTQGGEDVNRDGWQEQPRSDRWGIRPRISLVDSAGRSLFVTMGYGYDHREGGTSIGHTAPDGVAFREVLTGRRMDLGANGRIPAGANGNFALRLALSADDRQRVEGTGPVEGDRISTAFVEVTRGVSGVRGAAVAGAVLQRDAYRNDLNGAFDHDWWTPGAFVTGEHDVGPVTLSTSARLDAHPVAGDRVTGRVAALVRPAKGWSVRLATGTGFAPPTALTEETEAVGLARVRAAGTLPYEASLGSTLDIAGRLGPWELLLTGYGATIRDQIQLADAGDSSGRGVLRTAAGPARYRGVEGQGVLGFRGGKLLLSYGYTDASSTDPETGVRGAVPLLPKHRAAADLMLERPGVYRVGLEATYYGVQTLAMDPYRARSRPYVYTMFLVMRRVGAVEVVANFENLLNVRQTDFAPLVRPTPGVAGRMTVDAWAPAEGFMANVAVRYRW